jgi:multidrug efflux pump subunit AcrA (membrane-fusion protein)
MKAGTIMNRLLILLLVTIVPWAAISCTNSAPAEGAGATKEAALRAKEVGVVQASRRDFEQALNSTGSLIPVETARIRALEQGPIVQVSVDIGDRVRAGQVLFRIRPIDAENALRSAEAQKATAEATLRDLEAWRRPEEVDVLQAQLERARVEARRLSNEKDRAATLLERGAISKSQWDQALTAAESAEAAQRVAEEQLRIAKAGPTREQVDVARSRVEEAAARLQESRQRLSDTVIEAPYSGFITGRFLEEGDFVLKGQEVVEISDTSHLEAEMNIPERYSGSLRVGLSVDVRIESVRASRQGKVVAVNESIDQKTRTFLVKVAVENLDNLIKAGAFCTGRYDLPPIENAIAVPANALLTREGQTFVWVAQDGTAHQVDVVVGERMDGWIEIVSGLTGSEQVVIEGAGALSRGDAVQIVPAAGSGGVGGN